MKTTTTKLQIRDTFPVRSLLVGASLFVTATLAFGQAAPSATEPQKDDVVKLEKYEVTGSRIKRLDSEAVSPVIQLSSADIEARGFNTLAEVLHTMSFNNGDSVKPIDAGNSFTPGVDAFNMRGMGVNSTLVMLDGRRAVTYAIPGFNGKQSMVDINSLPDAAIESIEILKDGGSAIYGSDAVVGVLNIKLRKNFQGAQVNIGYGDYFNTSAATKYASVALGATTGKLNILMAGSWRDTGGIMGKDLYYTRSVDNNGLVSKANARYYITGNANLKDALANGFDDVYTTPAVDAYTFNYFNYSSPNGFPGYVNVGGKDYTFAGPTNDPKLENAVVDDPTNRTNPYDYKGITTFVDERRSYSFFTRAAYDFTDYLKGVVELSYTHNEAYSAAAPTPVGLSSEQGETIGSRMYIPAENPYNPWNQDIYTGGRRLVETAVRGHQISANTPRILIALEGKLPDAGFFKDWTWEIGALYTQNEVTDAAPGSVTDYRMQQALLGLVNDGTGGLKYNPAAPASERKYFNWFGYNDPAFAEFLAIENPTTAKSKLTSYDFRVGGPIAHLPAGDIGLSIGAEHYTQSMKVNRTDLNNVGNIVGGSWQSGWSGDRTVDAVYAEINIPIFKWLEAQVAGRFESYSDKDFEERVRPKLGLKVRPLDWLILRASYSQSYTAPDLAYLYQGLGVSFSSGQVKDPITGISQQLEYHSVGDLSLKPESTDTYYAGFAVEPQRGKLKGFYFGVDFFRFERENLLSAATALVDTWANFFRKADAGIQPYKDMVVRDPDTNRLLYINLPYLNLSNAHWVGYDFEVSYKWRTQRYGDFRVGLNGSYTVSDKWNAEQTVGDTNNRRLIADLGVQWKYRNWGAYVACNYIKGTDVSYQMDASDDPAIGDLYLKYRIKDQFVFNAGVSYSGLWKTRISLGVTNVFNQRPPVFLDSDNGAYTDPNWVLPASWYLKVSKDF